MDYDINLPEKIHVSDVDISIIIGNLLDNAVEACQKIEAGKRYIKLSIKYGYGKIDIAIVNPIQDKIDSVEKYDTTKKDKKNHGFGIDNIRKTVEKYKGYLEIITENNEFKVKIIL